MEKSNEKINHFEEKFDTHASFFQNTRFSMDIFKTSHMDRYLYCCCCCTQINTALNFYFHGHFEVPLKVVFEEGYINEKYLLQKKLRHTGRI